MAANILQVPHPISTLPRDCELSQILELRDPFLIPLSDLDRLIQKPQQLGFRAGSLACAMPG